MQTRVIRIESDTFDALEISEAAKCVREGGLVAFPTETVYGIAVNLDNKEAVDRLLKVREMRRPRPLTLHVAARDQALEHVVRPLSPAAQRLIRKFWPGPLTVVFPAFGGGTIGIRYPNHRVACELIRQAGVRVGGPSANHAGGRPAVNAEQVLHLFDGKIEFVLDAGPTRYRKSSSVVRVHEKGMEIEVLRAEAIPEGVIREVGGRTVLFVCTGNTCRSPMAEGLFRLMLAGRLGVAEEHLADRGWRVLSAGTAAGSGGPAADNAVRAVERYGVDLRSHTSRPVTISMVEDADKVYAMTKLHQRVLMEWMPDCADRVELLDPGGREIPDPFGANLQVYQERAQEIRACLEERLEEMLAS